MHTKNSLIADIKKAGINSTGTLLIHSSMKAIGEVEGGADTVLDAFILYMKDGLLLFHLYRYVPGWMVCRIYVVTNSSNSYD